METVAQNRPRLHVLLTEDRPHGPEHWSRQLPQLLAPQGIETHTASTGREALDLIERVQFHAAVIDLATPPGDVTTGPAAASGGASGLSLLDLFRRLPGTPPIVVLRSPAFTKRQAERLLVESMRLGAFSVLDKPVDLERLLAVFRRMMDRHYRGSWPDVGRAGLSGLPGNSTN